MLLSGCSIIISKYEVSSGKNAAALSAVCTSEGCPIWDSSPSEMFKYGRNVSKGQFTFSVGLVNLFVKKDPVQLP